MAARVLIVDDHAAVRIGHRQIVELEKDMEVCGEAASSEEALAKAQTTQPDLVLIDICLAERASFELVRQIRAACPRVRILAVSYLDESTFAEMALRAGAHGYVHKSESPEVLVGAIRRVLAGEMHVGGEVAARLLRRMVGAPSGPSAPPMTTLSEREFEVFQLISQGLGNKAIARQLGLRPKTIETHRDAIRKKLGLASGSDIVRYATHWAIFGDVPAAQCSTRFNRRE